MITLIRKAFVPDDSPIVQAAQRLESAMRDAFLAAVKAAKNQVNVDELARAIERGDVHQALAVLALDEKFVGALKGVGLEAGIQSVRDAVQATFAAGAKAAITMLPRNLSVEMSFNLMNPEAVKFLDNYTFGLIQQATQDTKSAIQQIVTRAFQEGGHPYEQAREIKGIIGLTGRMEQAVANYRSSLESGLKGDLNSALTRALRDGRFDRTLLRSLRSGSKLSQAQIDKMVDRYREKYLAYRAKNIARTETIRASTKGQRELWRQAVEQGLMSPNAKRRWVISGDERTCDHCNDLNGEVRGLDEEFEPGIMDPPDAHPSCRCTVVLVSDSLKMAA